MFRRWMPYRGVFYVFSYLGVYLKGVLFVSPLIGCTGRSILHCEFSICFIVSRASHCLCTHSMASATSASFAERPLPTQKPPRWACPCSNIWCRVGACKVWGLTLHWAVSFSSWFPLTDTAMSIFCAPHTCSGQAGVLGNGAQPSAGAAYKLAAGLARTGRTAWAAMWWVESSSSSAHPLELGGQSQHMLDVFIPKFPEHTRYMATTKCSVTTPCSANTRCSVNIRSLQTADALPTHI